eukprot:GHRR01005429.1.p1 GENE.GHRR01005429.1~~GHRR01005429.1.p1  ORF type:complete len:213 (+),score=21.16 GHRR01005429.1:279-917(+)
MATAQKSLGQLPVLGAVTGGLLCSSCCVVQLLLNYTSIGCAGFSALTPYKNYFRVLNAGFLGYIIIQNGFSRRTLTTVAVSILLMFSQDILSLHNSGCLPQLSQLLANYKLLPTNAAVLPASKVMLQVQGMRCEGCASRLRSKLGALEGVDNCTVLFQGGLVTVWSNSTQAVKPEVLVEAIKATDDSYNAVVVGKECYTADDKQVPCPDDKD